MKTRFTVALSMLAGAALGGGAIQALHPQAKPPARRQKKASAATLMGIFNIFQCNFINPLPLSSTDQPPPERP